jgi:hypothetical protein
MGDDAAGAVWAAWWLPPIVDALLSDHGSSAFSVATYWCVCACVCVSE